jgi:pimeloyl-ACP methyl ester carboxylesterase
MLHPDYVPKGDGDEKPRQEAKGESPWFLLMYRKQSRQILRRFENEHIYADQTEHRLLPRDLGGWLKLQKVIPALQAEGHEVMAAQYGLDTPEGDVATVKRTLGRVSSPAILVGHSYGGSVITAAGTDDRVAGLVYIAALAPDVDETSQSQQEKFPVTDVFKYVEVADGRIWMRPEGVVCFAGDLSEQEQKVVWATHYAPAADLFSRNAPGTAWKSKPSWYIVANNDRTVQPELQRFLAKRMGATTHAVDSSHVVMLSHADLVIDVIRAAAKAVQGSSATA